MKTVLFFISNARNGFSEHLEGVHAYAHRRNWHVQVVSRAMTRELVRESIAFWKPIGVLVEYDGQSVLRDSRLFGDIPVVSFDTGQTKPRRGTYIAFDSVAAGRMGADHLLQLDLPTYAYVGFWSSVVWDRERESAFRRAIQAAGKTCLTFRCTTSRTERMRRLQDWLNALPRPCGVMAANDLAAEEVLSVCIGEGIAVPDDLAVLGVDDFRPLCEALRPTLSSIAHPILREGYRAAQVLDELMGAPAGGANVSQVIRFPPERLVVRQSTRRLVLDRSKVAAALETIRERACAGLRVEEVVAVMGVTRRMAERHFRLATGHSIHEEIDRVRFEKVYELLANPNCRIDAIAGRSGFSTEVALRKAFRQREGCSMSVWRGKHCGR